MNVDRLSRKSLDLLLDLGLTLVEGELLGAELQGLGLPLVAALLGALRLLLLERVLADLLVDVLVELLKTVGLNLVVNVALELGLVTLLIVVGKSLHVLGDVATHDVLAESLGVELLGLNVETRETLLGVGDVKSTVGCTLHGTEDTGTSRGTGKTDIEEALEWAAGLAVDLSLLGELVLAISLLDTGEGLVEVELLERTAGDEKTSAVSGGPVGETVGETVGLELVGVSAGEDLVAGDLRGDDLADDVAVGEADDQAVLGCVVLVLGLGDQTLASIVIGLSGSSTLVLDLVAPVRLLDIFVLNQCSLNSTRDLREVRRVLDQLGLKNIHESAICASEPFSEASCGDSRSRQSDARQQMLRRSIDTYERHVGRLATVVGRGKEGERFACARKVDIIVRSQYFLARLMAPLGSPR